MCKIQRPSHAGSFRHPNRGVVWIFVEHAPFPVFIIIAVKIVHVQIYLLSVIVSDVIENKKLSKIIFYLLFINKNLFIFDYCLDQTELIKLNMRTETKTRTRQILKLTNIVVWIAFIGYLIEGGGMLTSFVVSCINPEASKSLYKGLDLHSLREFSFWHYSLHVYFVALGSLLKAYVWFLVMKILSEINLNSPFTTEVAYWLEKISYVLFAAWLIAFLNNIHVEWLLKETKIEYSKGITDEFMFMAGLVFIISQIFKRGVEIQSENELTV
jgi:hypothetical protein